MAILPHKMQKASGDILMAIKNHPNGYAYATLAFAVVLWIILIVMGDEVAVLFSPAFLVGFGVPFILLWKAIRDGKPRSFPRALVYITTITSILFTLPFVVTGTFKSESVILLGIPFIVLWLAGFCAILAVINKYE